MVVSAKSAGEFLARGGFSAHFVGHFDPLVACVWSSGARDAAAYPAAHLFASWTTTACSRSPARRPGARSPAVGALWEALAAGAARRAPGLPVRAIERHDDGVSVRLRDGSCLAADRVVLATHADEAAGVLVDATPAEKSALTAIPYSPQRDRPAHGWFSALTRAAGELELFARHAREEPIVRVDYWMNKLHRPDADRDYVVTLNGETQVAPETILARATYHHPVFTRASVAGQQPLRDLGGRGSRSPAPTSAGASTRTAPGPGLAAAERLGGRW